MELVKEYIYSPTSSHKKGKFCPFPPRKSKKIFLSVSPFSFCFPYFVSVVERMNVLKRQQQIDYGKNTLGYAEYLKEVPKSRRSRRHPKTPDIILKVSKRAFNGIVKRWRQALHEYDPFPRKDIHKRQDFNMQTYKSSVIREKISSNRKNCSCLNTGLTGEEIELNGRNIISPLIGFKKDYRLGSENWEESVLFSHLII